MFLERLRTALRSFQWEDTISFHGRLFRCFVLGFLDSHSEFAALSRGSERMLAVLGRRLADVGVIRNAGYLHEPVSHRQSPSGRHSDTTTRCPPKRYEATPLTAPSFVSQPINITHGLYDKPLHSVVAFDLSGSGRALGSHDVSLTGVVGCTLLWLLILVIVVSRTSSMARGRQSACQPPRAALNSTTNAGERMNYPLPQDHLPINEATQFLITSTTEDVDHRACMPGAWLHRHQLDALEEPMFGSTSWTPLYLGARARMKALAHTLIFTALDPSNHGLYNMITIGRKHEDSCSSVCQGQGSNDVDLDDGISTPAALDGTERQGAAQDRFAVESGFSTGNLRESTVVMHNRRCEPSVVDDVAIKSPDSVRPTTPDVVCGDRTETSFALAASSNLDQVPCQGDISSHGDESASEDGSDGAEDEALFGTGTRRAGILPMKRQDEYHVLGRRQDGALSDAGCPLSPRRARSTGYLWKKRDLFDDDDEGTGEDSYWTEQVNARLSGERDSRHAPCRYGWSDGTSWPREAREDETDNWRTRNLQATHFTAPDKTSDALQCRADSTSTKLRRYSSPPLNSLSQRAGSGDGPQGIYVVPQKRGRTMDGRCWSPVSSPRTSDHSSGLGFLPFRRTPSLLTPQAWTQGCLHIPDPPVDESRQADVWWDDLTAVGSCGSASLSAHAFGIEAVIRDASEHGPPFPRDAQDAPISWRDRYENDPASRRFVSAHRRAITEG